MIVPVWIPFLLFTAVASLGAYQHIRIIVISALWLEFSVSNDCDNRRATEQHRNIQFEFKRLTTYVSFISSCDSRSKRTMLFLCFHHIAAIWAHGSLVHGAVICCWPSGTLFPLYCFEIRKFEKSNVSASCYCKM